MAAGRHGAGVVAGNYILIGGGGGSGGADEERDERGSRSTEGERQRFVRHVCVTTYLI